MISFSGRISPCSASESSSESSSVCTFIISGSSLPEASSVRSASGYCAVSMTCQVISRSASLSQPFKI